MTENYILDYEMFKNQDFTPNNIKTPFELTLNNLTAMTANLILNATNPLPVSHFFRIKYSIDILPQKIIADYAFEIEQVNLPAFNIFVDSENIYFNAMTTEKTEIETFAKFFISDFFKSPFDFDIDFDKLEETIEEEIYFDDDKLSKFYYCAISEQVIRKNTCASRQQFLRQRSARQRAPRPRPRCFFPQIKK